MGNGARRPKKTIPGSDLAGTVESIGTNVSRFRAGDEVFGETDMSWVNGGAFAEYAVAREDWLALKPGNVSFAQAASVGTSGLIALTNLRPERIKPGHHLLINGAGGNVGSLAIQIAKSRGAHVTGVDHSCKLELIRSLGADRVIDYTKEDVLQSTERYDLIFDVASTLNLKRAQHLLKATGTYWVVGHDNFSNASGRVLGSIPYMLGLMLRASLGHPHLAKPDFKTMPSRRSVMETLKELMASGTLTPVIGKTFALDEVPSAIRCMEQGGVAGRIVIVPDIAR
jgi:NADPH:quinone reductase-like Zn-dependent oxidoreductase